jgi:hypothetical protein
LNNAQAATRVDGDGQPAADGNPLTYSPRLVKAFPPLEAAGRALKVYGLFAEPDSSAAFPPPQWLRQQAAGVLAGPPGAGDHPAGFLILHYGMDGNYLLVSQWYDANNLKHWVRGSAARAAAGTAFTPLAQRDLVACVWELEIIKFERDAWVNTVLACGHLGQAAIDAYLATTFSGWV